MQAWFAFENEREGEGGKDTGLEKGGSWRRQWRIALRGVM